MQRVGLNLTFQSIRFRGSLPGYRLPRLTFKMPSLGHVENAKKWKESMSQVECVQQVQPTRVETIPTPVKESVKESSLLNVSEKQFNDSLPHLERYYRTMGTLKQCHQLSCEERTLSNLFRLDLLPPGLTPMIIMGSMPYFYSVICNAFPSLMTATSQLEQVQHGFLLTFSVGIMSLAYTAMRPSWPHTGKPIDSQVAMTGVTVESMTAEQARQEAVSLYSQYFISSLVSGFMIIHGSSLLAFEWSLLVQSTVIVANTWMAIVSSMKRQMPIWWPNAVLYAGCLWLCALLLGRFLAAMPSSQERQKQLNPVSDK